MKTRRILLIENKNAIREVTQLCLETVEGWEVLTAVSSQEAIAKTKTQKVDVILVDLDTFASDRDLSTILHQLQNNPVTQDIPVILLTTTVLSKKQFTKLGVRTAIAKPFDLITLASQVSAVLGWNQ
ncbi:MAG: response regulator [Nostoc sp.]|uniref:response regulator n=1 Tax=unclassified Nostoc TaxID=2593658 RepID=UPI0025ECCE90|nr:response regulator [Nostoc sp. NMS9]